MIRCVFFVLLVLAGTPSFSQQRDSLQVDRQRLRTVAIGGGATYGLTMAGLYHLWYKDAGSQPFTFFNDNREWKQVDKVGHFFSAFYFSYGTAAAMKWCNIPDKKAALIGSITGFAVLFPVEVFDGFSPAYGASSGDLIANASGAGFFLAQHALWNEVRIIPRFSFQRTGYAPLRPNVLGDYWTSELIKDYNGQTYWLSFDIDKFVRFPKWLNIAVGYGANGMVYANDRDNLANGFNPRRQWYLSLDFDVSHVKSRYKAVNAALFVVNMIKIPAPTLEWSKGSMRFHPLYF